MTRRAVRCAVAGLLAIAGACGGPARGLLPVPGSANAAAPGAIAPVVPMAADAFVDSIGVNTHLDAYLAGPGRYALAAQRMKELGVRHVRDGIFPGQTAHENRDERRFFAATGARMMGLVDCPKPLGYFPGAQTPPRVIRAFDAAVGNAIELLEGPNEPDLRRVAGWAPRTRACIARVDRGKALAVPFVAPAMGDPLNASKLGSIATLIDIGGIHRYFSGHEPETHGFWRSSPCGRWEAMRWNVCEARVNAGASAPLYVTETGWTTFGEIDEKTHGKYVARVLFYDSLQGIARTYLYDFENDGDDPKNSEDGYGLFHHDGTPKPAFNAVRAIVATLSDPGPAFSTTPVSYAIDGPATMESELFEKRDRTYVLAMWNATPSWDPATNREIPVAPSPVRVRFARAPSSLAFVSLGDDGRPVAGRATISGNVANLRIDDRMAFLSFRF